MAEEALQYYLLVEDVHEHPPQKRGIIVLPHMRISAHTRMGRPIRVRDIPYAYGPILCPIRVWASHMSMHA